MRKPHTKIIAPFIFKLECQLNGSSVPIALWAGQGSSAIADFLTDISFLERFHTKAYSIVGLSPLIVDMVIVDSRILWTIDLWIYPEV